MIANHLDLFANQGSVVSVTIMQTSFEESEFSNFESLASSFESNERNLS